MDYTRDDIEKLTREFHAAREAFDHAEAVYLDVLAHSDKPSRFGESKYPWHLIEAGEAKFFVPADSKAEKLQIQNSLTSAASKRYGKGACRVAMGRNGVWVTRKRELVRI